MLNVIFRTILLKREIHAGETSGSVHTALERFWQGRVYSVLLSAPILSNPFYKNNDGYVSTLGNLFQFFTEGFLQLLS